MDRLTDVLTKGCFVKAERIESYTAEAGMVLMSVASSMAWMKALVQTTLLAVHK